MAIFHCHVSAVSAGNGHSAVASAAYQAREELTHEQQKVGSVSVGIDDNASKYQFSADKRALTKGEVSDNLRKVFKDNGITLSDAVTAQKDNRRQWTVSDGDKTYTVKEYRQTTSEVVKDEHGNIEKDKNDKPKRKQTVTGQGLDIYADKTHRYGTKEDLRNKWIRTEQGVTAPDWVKDRGTMWNQASHAENRRDGVEAFKFTVALPRELSESGNVNLVNAWVDREFTSKSAICDIAVHRVEASDSTPDQPLYNDHAHIMVTTRTLSADGKGFADTKNEQIGRNWQNNIHDTQARDAQILEWRKSWEEVQNQHLANAGSDARVDHRSHQDRGLDRKPQLHMGKKAHEAEKNGVQTKRGDRNAMRKEHNRQNEETQKRIQEHQQKEPHTKPEPQKQRWWGRIISRHKPIETKDKTQKPPLARKRRWAFKMKAVQRLKWVREQKPKPVERKQVTKAESERKVRERLAKRLPKRSHAEQVQQQKGEQHGIRR